MRKKLNSKQINWIRQNVKNGMTLNSTDTQELKVVETTSSGYYGIEVKLITQPTEENYNMGLITFGEYTEGQPIVKTHISTLGCSSTEWIKYFPTISEIKSK